ncbi:hypothetical protein ABTK05_20975, partial [Acinetobacter baumannii]
DQDASYFGCWVNIERRMTMCYAEGDRTLVVCPNEESLKAELADMEKFYGPPPAAFRHISPDRHETRIICERPSVTP